MQNTEHISSPFLSATFFSGEVSFRGPSRRSKRTTHNNWQEGRKTGEVRGRRERGKEEGKTLQCGSRNKTRRHKKHLRVRTLDQTPLLESRASVHEKVSA